ncbi:MAG: UDP-N-acetylglucosamine--LPS N-acetylglucosamine transferase [Deltaproteobacteria bacterium]|nr:UDP-N-acetylglucosamine--LPS N-acetylglucosamine transferase [Deltaproteobacteria bacterium]
MSRGRPETVLLVASHGGHWAQLRRLDRAFEGMRCVYLSTEQGLEAEVAPAQLHVVMDANLQTRGKLLVMAAQVLRVMVRIRPTLVVSTGAAPGFFALLYGKAMGARTIWVDSVANAERLSVSGAKVRPFADLWLTQWPHLARPEGPRYEGSVL